MRPGSACPDCGHEVVEVRASTRVSRDTAYPWMRWIAAVRCAWCKRDCEDDLDEGNLDDLVRARESA